MWLRTHKKVGFTPMQVNRHSVELRAGTPWEPKINDVHSTKDADVLYSTTENTEEGFESI